MSYKWMGAILIIAGCGGLGSLITMNHRKEKKSLQQLIGIIQNMESELQYRLTALPELCREAARRNGGVLGNVFQDMARELEWQISPDAGSCMAVALKKNQAVPTRTRRLLVQLGHSLGRFDLAGQLNGLVMVRAVCERELLDCGKDWDVRIRSYRTLGICAGAALAILFA